MGSLPFSSRCSSPETEPRSPAVQADSFPAEPTKPKNTGVGSLTLLQRIFPTQELTGVSCIAGGFLTSWAIRETLSRKPTKKKPTHHCFFFFNFLEKQVLTAAYGQMGPAVLPTHYGACAAPVLVFMPSVAFVVQPVVELKPRDVTVDPGIHQRRPVTGLWGRLKVKILFLLPSTQQATTDL